MKTFEEYKKKQMQDPEFVKEYEAIQPASFSGWAYNI